MRLNTTQRYAVLMLVIAPLAFPQQNSIRSEIQKVYDFQPHLLNKVQTEQKSQVLDQFLGQSQTTAGYLRPGTTPGTNRLPQSAILSL